MAYPEHFQGWLLKWTNYIRGYQKRWFVLERGLLSYYRAQEEMAHTCRGTVNLAGAFIDNIDSTNFVITNGPQVYYLRASSNVEKQRWMTALTLAKAKAIKNLESESEGEGEMSAVKGAVGRESKRDEGMAELRKKMKELTAAHDMVVKNSHLLLKQITEVEGWGGQRSAGSQRAKVDQSLREKVSLFRLTTDAMVKASEDYLQQARGVHRRWSRDLQSERDLRVRLQENMETLANQIHGLETDARRSVAGGVRSQRSGSQGSREVPFPTPPASDDSRGQGATEAAKRPETGMQEVLQEEVEEEMFFDAHEASAEEWARARRSEFMEESESLPGGGGEREGPAASENTPPFNAKSMEEKFSKVSPSFFDKIEPTVAVRRTAIPPRPNVNFNLWSFVKNSVGRDLTKLPMPVSINQPLSFLQRMVEDLVYADSLNKAVSSETTLEELTHVAAFACSVYAQTASKARVTKPFNPLLGETFECDRRAESGWRCLMEQVSHHPPMFAMHVEHKDWTLWEEYTMASKFRGKYVACYPIGVTHLILHHNGSHYTWTKVVSTVHNIIIGNMWIDQSGPMKVANHTTGEEALLNFHAYAYFTRERQRKVTGTVKDTSGTLHYKIKGYWDDYLECSHAVSEREGEPKAIELPKPLWKAIPHRPGSEVIYGFSEFACGLNEPEEGVALTDSRLRPDQRIMENGDFDTAGTEKLRLEDKQRAKRREREEMAARAVEAAANGNHEEASRLQQAATYSPLWFRKEFDTVTNTMMHVYRGGYWEGKYRGWSGVEFPDIF